MVVDDCALEDTARFEVDDETTGGVVGVEDVVDDDVVVVGRAGGVADEEGVDVVVVVGRAGGADVVVGRAGVDGVGVGVGVTGTTTVLVTTSLDVVVPAAGRAGAACLFSTCSSRVRRTCA